MNGTTSSSNSVATSFEDDDMMMMMTTTQNYDLEDETKGLTTTHGGSTRDPYQAAFEIGSVGSGRKTDDEEDEDEDALHRGYDANQNTHDNADYIRQEALRMLQVADADPRGHHHVRGHSAERKVPRALNALNYVASRQNHGQSFREFPTTPTTSVEYENHHSVVDVEGIQSRSEFTEDSASAGRSGNNNWSSRYSIDNTLLAMSGGMSKHDRMLDKMDREHRDARMASFNLFPNSPTANSQIFGSGFSFRQNHVFGKQNVNANLHYNDAAAGSLPPANSRVKTWQEQLQAKKRQQRRYIALAIVFVVAVGLGVASFFGRQARQEQFETVPADGDHGSVTFHVMGDGMEIDPVSVKKNLAITSRTTSFAVHLGNIQDASITKCEESQYETVADMLEQASPVRMFVVPGEEDWNNCPDPDFSSEVWSDNFLNFDMRWDDVKDAIPFEVMRQPEELENWAFRHAGVLFLGLNVVNGKVPDADEFMERNENNYQWFSRSCKHYEDTIRSIVVFANARPGLQQNANFFAQFEDFMRNFDRPLLYVHAASINDRGKESVSSKTYQPFRDLPNVYAAQIESRNGVPPVRTNVGFGEMPFQVGV
jgi:hypothetical protein